MDDRDSITIGAVTARLTLVFLSLTLGASAGSAQSPTPDHVCKYNRIADIRAVKKPAEYRLDLAYHPHVLDLTYTFPPGTMVSVNRQQDGWSCVYGNKKTSNGLASFSGWIRTTQLEGPSEARSALRNKTP